MKMVWRLAIPAKEEHQTETMKRRILEHDTAVWNYCLNDDGHVCEIKSIIKSFVSLDEIKEQFLEWLHSYNVITTQNNNVVVGPRPFLYYIYFDRTPESIMTDFLRNVPASLRLYSAGMWRCVSKSLYLLFPFGDTLKVLRLSSERSISMSGIGVCMQLHTLELECDGLESAEEISCLESLVEMKLERCKNTNLTCQSLPRSLRRLILREVMAVSFPCITKLPNLDTLSCSMVSWPNSSCQPCSHSTEFCSSGIIPSLSVSMHGIRLQTLDSLLMFRGLTALSLGGCKPRDISALSKLFALRFLRWDGPNKENVQQILENCKNLKKLRELKLFDILEEECTLNMWKALAQLRQLTSLVFEGFVMEDHAFSMEKFSALTNLRYLELSNLWIDENSLEHLASMVELVEMKVDEVQFESHNKPHFKEFKKRVSLEARVGNDINVKKIRI